MGLDMYAYVAQRAGQQSEFYDQDITFNKEKGDWDVPEGGVEKPREIAYWRKHPNLHGWMEQLWIRKLADLGKTPPGDSNYGSTFNGIELELTWDDLEQLETDIRQGDVAEMNVRGFFFGDGSDDYYRESDLKFIREAKAELITGLKVFYNSSW